jgi:hypothetical protein
MKYDLHTHYYPKSYFDKIRELSSVFTFDTDPTGRAIIKLRGARFFGITPPIFPRRTALTRRPRGSRHR